MVTLVLVPWKGWLSLLPQVLFAHSSVSGHLWTMKLGTWMSNDLSGNILFILYAFSEGNSCVMASLMVLLGNYCTVVLSARCTSWHSCAECTRLHNLHLLVAWVSWGCFKGSHTNESEVSQCGCNLIILIMSDIGHCLSACLWFVYV